MADTVKVDYKGRIAVITIDNAKKLGALDFNGYYQLAKSMREIATHDEVFITVLTGKGTWTSCYQSHITNYRRKLLLGVSSDHQRKFVPLPCPQLTLLSGADVSSTGDQPEGDVARHWLTSFVANNLNITHSFYTHPKIIVTALNGPVIGLSAALVAFSDFIYAVPHTFLLTPFSSIGLVTEGLASRAFVQRLGISKANEALIMSKRISAEELLQVGFVNKIFDTKKGEDEKFKALVFEEIENRLGIHLIGSSLIKIKELIRKPDRDVMDAQGVAEVFGGFERFMSGIPQEEFRKIASGEKRHKL